MIFAKMGLWISFVSERQERMAARLCLNLSNVIKTVCERLALALQEN